MQRGSQLPDAERITSSWSVMSCKCNAQVCDKKREIVWNAWVLPSNPIASTFTPLLLYVCGTGRFSLLFLLLTFLYLIEVFFPILFFASSSFSSTFPASKINRRKFCVNLFLHFWVYQIFSWCKDQMWSTIDVCFDLPKSYDRFQTND